MRIFAFLFAFLLVLEAPAQQARIPRVGVLQNGTVALNGYFTEAFAGRLAELGYVHGRNVTLEVRYADGKLDRLPEIAKELDALNLDVFFTPSALASHAARKAGVRAPIVFALTPDPVAEGFAQTLARPGGNMTGLTSLSPEMAAKRIELLREALPRLSRVAVLTGLAFPGVPAQLAQAERAVNSMGKEFLPVDVKKLDELEAAFAAVAKSRADVVLVVENPMFFQNRRTIVALAEQHRLPAIYVSREYVEAGGLMSYGSNYVDLVRRAAGYAARIIKGAKAGELPIEQPIEFELVVNLRTARALGVTIPRTLLLRADQVIE